MSKRDDDVLADAQIADDALGLAVLGAERDIMMDGVQRIADGDGLVLQVHLAGGRVVRAEEQTGDLAAAGASRPEKPLTSPCLRLMETSEMLLLLACSTRRNSLPCPSAALPVGMLPSASYSLPIILLMSSTFGSSAVS